jgi:hypothetical protein
MRIKVKGRAEKRFWPICNFSLLRLIDVCRRSLYLSDANNDLQLDKKKKNINKNNSHKKAWHVS